jgi:hypothetical protein
MEKKSTKKTDVERKELRDLNEKITPKEADGVKGGALKRKIGTSVKGRRFS